MSKLRRKRAKHFDFMSDMCLAMKSSTKNLKQKKYLKKQSKMYERKALNLRSL